MGFRSTGRGNAMNTIANTNNNISAELKHILATNNAHSRKIRNTLSFNQAMTTQSQHGYVNGHAAHSGKESRGTQGFKIINQSGNMTQGNSPTALTQA